MKPHVRRSTRPAPKFYKPYTKIDTDGNVTIPEVKLLKYGTGMGKAYPADLIAERLIVQHRINKSNLPTIGKRIAKDFAHTEGQSSKDIYHMMTVLVEGADMFKSMPVDALFAFRKAYNDNKQLGAAHPAVIQQKQNFMCKAGFTVPEQFWNITPQQSAENALKEFVLLKSTGIAP